MAINNELIEDIDLEDAMAERYLDYSLSVIRGRALPDIRDGLKPVHRRILYAMNELNLTFKSPYKKSARIVGDVIGKYHPHGDTAVYDAMVRLAQDFSMNIPLIDGQGNYGSIDGDNAAAMRYTEARMSKLGQFMLVDIDRNTVDFKPNYDDSTTEPEVLPTIVPSLLLNGTSGIAVGMTSNIPPHNLDELIDALSYVIKLSDRKLKDTDVVTEELLKIVKGPDFPTGGIIFGRQGIHDAYKTGKGRIKVRARVEILEDKKKTQLVITELPYAVNKIKLIETIVQLVKDKVIGGIAEVTDNSDRRGMSLVIVLKKDAYAEIVLNKLYKHTNLETTISINMLAIDNGEPVRVTLLQYLRKFIDFRRTITIRRTLYELEGFRKRLHIVEGLVKALGKIDLIIKKIKESKTDKDAIEKLMAIKFTEIQARSILEIRLKRLTGLEYDKLDSERRELEDSIATSEDILSSTKNIDKEILKEWKDVVKLFKTSNRTEIVDDYSDIDIEDLIPNEQMVVTITHRGYIKRVPASVYTQQGRGGTGKKSGTVYDDDFLKDVYTMYAHDTIIFVTKFGKAFRLKVYKLPEASRTARGQNIVNIIELEKGDKIVSMIPVKEKFCESSTLLTVTKNGLVKQTDLKEYSRIRSTGIIALKINEDDEVLGAKVNDKSFKSLMLLTKTGKTIRFKTAVLNLYSRNTKGVKGIELAKGDEVVDFALTKTNEKILTITEHGIGKISELKQYRPQGRGGKGLIGIKLTEKTGNAVALTVIEDKKDLMFLSSKGKLIRVDPASQRAAGRNTTGVKFVKLAKDEILVSVTKAEKEDSDD
jgi:DNA gyrase subunit A